MKHFTFQSYAWSLGTTSFRMAEFHKKVEEQLILLQEFWEEGKDWTATWQSNPNLQANYYKFAKAKGFVTGDLPEKDIGSMAKTAREKTSGLVNIGLLYENRKITPVGKTLLSMARTGNFSSNNAFGLPGDSFLYFKQLLKTSVHIQSGNVRPMLVVGKAIMEAEGYLTDEEFTYLLPLCINEESYERIIGKIPLLRTGKTSVAKIIEEEVLKKYNYPEALAYLLQSEKTPEDISTIGMNRKSPKYDLSYVTLYQVLSQVYLLHNQTALPELAKALKSIKGKAGSLWRSLLFKKLTAIPSSENLRKSDFDKVESKNDLASTFFNYLHVFKIMATLLDYKDLNRRYLGITDAFIFRDETVRFAPIFEAFFNTEASLCFNKAFSSCTLLNEDVSLEEINPNLRIHSEELLGSFNLLFKKDFSTLQELQGGLEEDRLDRFKKLIDEKLPNSKLAQILKDLEKRDKDINLIEEFGGEADIPTIFEYVTGIAWYRLSQYRGDILKYMNLSLNANLLPVSHAVGGKADIVYKYPKTQYYPKHSLLIECTLLKSTGQRHAEMEPVSRHLSNYMLDEEKNAYCVFVATDLHPSIISDFRARKYAPYYRSEEEFVAFMKIIPLSTKELRTILQKNICYSDLYAIFETAFHDQTQVPPVWYKECIESPINLD